MVSWKEGSRNCAFQFSTSYTLDLKNIHSTVPRVKQSVYETDHSFPSNAEFEKAWRHTSTPSYVCMQWCLIKHRTHLQAILLT